MSEATAGAGHEGHWFLTGFSGAGKTTVGRIVAQAAGRTFVDLDELVERRCGKTVPEVIAAEGEAAFRQLEADALDAALGETEALLVVALGGGTLEHAASRRRIADAGLVIWLDVPLAACLRRLGRDPIPRPILDRARRQGGAEAVEALFRRRLSGHAAADLRLDGRGPAERVAARVLSALREAPGAVT